LVKKWLKKHKNIRLHFLPAYHPNLNPIERLRGFFKKTILYNKSIEKFSDFQESCRNFFRCQKKYAESLRTLVTDNFHLVKKTIFKRNRVYFYFLQRYKLFLRQQYIIVYYKQGQYMSNVNFRHFIPLRRISWLLKENGISLEKTRNLSGRSRESRKCAANISKNGISMPKL
jgi:hypothetical protein